MSFAISLMHDPAILAAQNEIRDHTLHVAGRYIGAGTRFVKDLAIPTTTVAPTFKLAPVCLPVWAADVGIGTPPAILVDPCCIVAGEGPEYERCDWLTAAHLHLSGWLERSIEDRKGPIQSYAFRLPREWSAAYDRAWVNRIFLLLRRMAARKAGLQEEAMFGPRPAAIFHLTHDVDALTKTAQMRLKSTAMSTIATFRHLAAGRFRSAASRAASAVHYAFTNSDYWLFDDVCKAEAERGFRSIFMFADCTANNGPVPWLMDPSYRTHEPRVTSLMRDLKAGGWQIGIHPGFNTWNDTARLTRTREEVAGALGQPVGLCRQHWLRFSWKDTWTAQTAAGIRLDFTLGFNDRSGFRNGAALRYRPWNREAGALHQIESLPTLVMDSHFYDYAFPDDPAAAMAPWIDEVIAVGGEASLLWHTHTMHHEIGWRPGYIALLDLLAQRGAGIARELFDG